MHIDADRVRRIAALARLDLTDDEADGAIRDLEAILAMIERMRAVDVDGVEPLAHPLEVAQRLRPDAVTESDRRAALQAGAPRVEDGLFVVPRVIE